jgi:hypothetical protein
VKNNENGVTMVFYDAIAPEAGGVALGEKSALIWAW